MDGWIILDKPSGMTSRAAGGRVARAFGAKTFGHIGTLDPMASGLILIGLGQATKMIPFMESGIKNEKLGIKEYLFTVKFGILTDTLDITGKIIRNEELGIRNYLDKEKIENACQKLVGEIMQVPPNFSAVHIGGRRAHELARNGMDFEIPARPVKIYSLELLELSGDNADFIVRCSPGTYVRSIARDIANICGTIGVASSIRRTKTNGFDIKDAVSLDFLENLVNNGAVADKYLHSIDFGLGDIPVLNLSENQAVLFKNGGFVRVIDNQKSQTIASVRVYSGDKFLGIGTLAESLLKPNRIIN